MATKRKKPSKKKVGSRKATKASSKKVKRKKISNKKVTSKKNVVKRKKASKVEKKVTRKTREEVDLIADISKEAAKLLSMGVDEKEVIKVMKDVGMPDEEIDRIMKDAKSMYLATPGKKVEENISHYEPNPWLMIVTIGILLGIAIFSIFILLQYLGVI